MNLTKAERDKIVWDRISAGEPGRWRKDNPFRDPKPIYVDQQPTIEEQKRKPIVGVIKHPEKKRNIIIKIIQRKKENQDESIPK